MTMSTGRSGSSAIWTVEGCSGDKNSDRNKGTTASGKKVDYETFILEEDLGMANMEEK